MPPLPFFLSTCLNLVDFHSSSPPKSHLEQNKISYYDLFIKASIVINTVKPRLKSKKFLLLSDISYLGGRWF